MKTTIFIQNLKCTSCVKTITKKVSQLLNCTEIFVNIDTSSITFNYLDDLDLYLVKECLKDIGYPEVGESNNFSTKAKSYISCALGKIS